MFPILHLGLINKYFHIILIFKMSKKHRFEKLRDRIKMRRIGEACIVRVEDVRGICPPNYEKTDSRPLISPKITEVKNFVMVYNEIEEQGGVKMIYSPPDKG